MGPDATLYTTVENLLTVEEVSEIVEGYDAQVKVEQDGDSILVAWPDVAVTIFPMPAEDVSEHLQGFAGFVTEACAGIPSRLSH